MQRRFVLERSVDLTGVSGTGTVVEGVQFSNGRCVILWLGAMSSMTMHDNIENVVAIHGHNGATELHWID